MKRLRVLVAALGLVVLSGCGGSDHVPEDAIAVVDGQPVPENDYEALLAQGRKSYEKQGREFPRAGSREYQTLKYQFVQYLVQRVQFEQRARDLDIEVTDGQVVARLDQITKQYFGGDAKKYEKQLQEQGLTDKQVRADIRSQLVSEGIFKVVGKGARVTDEEIRNHYEQHVSQYSQPQSREVRHILVKTRNEALDVRRQLQNGGDFAALASRYSTDTGSKQKGGKLTVSKGQTVAPFDQTAFLLPVNRISGPVKTQFGYHIIQPISEVREAKTTPLKDVRESIRQQLLQTEKNEAMTRWVTEASEELTKSTRYRTGFAPPPPVTTGGTLTNETTP